MPLPLFRVFICVISIIFVFLLTRLKLDTVISAYLLSFGISYFLYYIAIFFAGLVFAPMVSSGHVFGTTLNFNQPIYLLIYTLAFIFQFSFAVLLFRIRRFQNGFPFLFKRYAVIVALVLTGIVLVLVSWARTLGDELDPFTAYLLIAGILIIGVGIFIWVRRGIRAYQKRRMAQRSDEYYTRELAAKDAEIERLNEKVMALQTVIHKYTNRLEAMEAARELQSEFQDELSKIKGKRLLPSTNINAIDNMFSYFADLFAAGKIEFHLTVSGSIPYMAEHVVDRSRLETLIGDHLKDALTAVSASGNPFRSVMAVIGLEGDAYAFTVFDSGVPFEADTLARLGTEAVTTHAGAGGSGIGFMTTFETMRACGASLIISEREPSDTDYTKSVSVRFDGKNRYIIKTHRPEAFPESGRYTVIGQ